ncbi:MAG TPA: SRPBCC family protein [Anaerolineae bacterium]|nr:SRPBCC family protein [Anaerolineae bacterium]
MRFKCALVDVGFAESAPITIKVEQALGASADKVFAILADTAQWPLWFPNMEEATYTSSSPYGAGSTRMVKVGLMGIDERIVAWEEGRRYSFRFEAVSLPIFRAFCEDYQLELIDEQRCRLQIQAGYEVNGLLKTAGFTMRPRFQRVFQEAALALAKYVEDS